jgi:hypothetical protein
MNNVLLYCFTNTGESNELISAFSIDFSALLVLFCLFFECSTTQFFIVDDDKDDAVPPVLSFASDFTVVLPIAPLLCQSP